jgi:hypothetical protein
MNVASLLNTLFLSLFVIDTVKRSKENSCFLFVLLALKNFFFVFRPKSSVLDTQQFAVCGGSVGSLDVRWSSRTPLPVSPVRYFEVPIYLYQVEIFNLFHLSYFRKTLQSVYRCIVFKLKYTIYSLPSHFHTCAMLKQQTVLLAIPWHGHLGRTAGTPAGHGNRALSSLICTKVQQF